MSHLRAFAPGRVNLMGDHTDHTGGLVLPMAIDLGTVVEGEPGGTMVTLRTAWDGSEASVPLDGASRTAAGWARYVAAVVGELRPTTGFTGTIATTLPVGAGLSSSAALEVALALALGFDGSAPELAALGQRAEHAATAVPSGIMDQLASAAGMAGHALRIDCHDLTVAPAPLPEDIEVVVAHSGVSRALPATPYADRVADLRAAEDVIGPLRSASLADLGALRDGTTRRRARHVLTENARVDAMAAALGAGDRPVLAALLRESHASLRDDLEVSVPEVDALVAAFEAVPRVLGARGTGAGFGGCVVALAERDAALPRGWDLWRVRAADGATCAGGDRPSWPRTPRC